MSRMDGEDVIAMCCLDTNPGQDPTPHPGTRSSVESADGTQESGRVCRKNLLFRWKHEPAHRGMYQHPCL
jgi:hypothetical protein